MLFAMQRRKHLLNKFYCIAYIINIIVGYFVDLSPIYCLHTWKFLSFAQLEDYKHNLTLIKYSYFSFL
jgi:hypothetical protein